LFKEIYYLQKNYIKFTDNANKVSIIHFNIKYLIEIRKNFAKFVIMK
jgi:hypothetical protein